VNIYSRWVIFFITVLWGQGCALSVHPYLAKKRDYKKDDYESILRKPELGSLYVDSSPGLFQDTRAARLGDIITIRIEESDSAIQQANTNLSRTSKYELSAPALLGLLQKLQTGGLNLGDAGKLISIMSDSKFSGDGKTTRSGKLDANLQARVKQILPNGDLFVEGHKIISVNGEDHHLYVSGAIRQQDIMSDNSISSTHIADAQVVFNGQGVVTEQQRQGWLARLMNYLSPF